VRNLVVCPQSWDELGTGVKTDKGDARALCVRLGLYAAGNRRIFSVAHVPTVREEQARAQTRLRDQLRRTRQRIEAQGRSARPACPLGRPQRRPDLKRLGALGLPAARMPHRACCAGKHHARIAG
jgi:transposase